MSPPYSAATVGTGAERQPGQLYARVAERHLAGRGEHRKSRSSGGQRGPGAKIAAGYSESV